MDAAMKAAITEQLRPTGFTGSLPHLRRVGEDRICLLSVQHHSSGGSFVIEVAACEPTGYTTSWGEVIDPKKVTAQDIPSQRPRLGAPGFPRSPGGDHWFVFGPPNYDQGSSKVQPEEHYRAIADEVISLVKTQAEPFWATVDLPATTSEPPSHTDNSAAE